MRKKEPVMCSLYSFKRACLNVQLSSGVRSLAICLKLPLVAFEPPHEKTCLQGLRPVKTQIGLLSSRD